MLSDQKYEPSIKFRDFWPPDDQERVSSYRKLWNRIGGTTTSTPPPMINWWKIATVAASAALLVISGLYWYTSRCPAIQPAEVIYIAEAPSQTILPDGTKVWLSACSQLRYPQIFTGETRNVYLKGEAYFEVTHDPEQSFRVSINDFQRVEVLGTSFNVRTYDDDSDVRIALVEGSVRIADEQSKKTVMLQSGQEAVIVKNTGQVTVNSVNIDMLMSWKTGKYVFNNQTFEDIAHVLEKGFDVSIRIENDDLRKKPYTMRFENGESLENILDLIQVNAKYTYKYENGNIVIK